MTLQALVLAACLALVGAPALAQPGQSMDLEKSVKRAIDANPSMQSAKQQIFSTQEGVRAATAAFAPTGTVTYYSRATNTTTPVTTAQDLTALYTAAGVNPGQGAATLQGKTYVVGDAYVANLDLNVSQPLFTGFRLLSSYQKSKLARDQAESLYKRTELTLIRSVQTAFLTLLKARSDVKSNQDSVARLDSQLKVTRAFYDVGLRPRLDVLQAESDLASAEQSLLAAQNSVDTQLAQLNALLNIPLDQPVDYVGQLTQNPFALTLRDALDEAYKQRPDIAIAVKSVEMSEKDASIALSGGLPQLRADYDFIRQGDKPWLRPENVTFSERHQFQLTFTWKAWDWGNTIFTYRQYSDVTKKLQADLAKLRLDVGAEVKTQFLNIQDAAKRINVAKTGLTAANEGYRMAVARYQAQVGTNTDVLDAQARVSRAEFQMTQALTDYQIAIANLYYSIGRKNMKLDS
ncbi:Outer membrane protein TolC [Fundidesulfovibrio magnetotacticus]|uniref:Outer membrane protein TolC n=1 Tax=Fundidesulfovibrio magnetotacticus TaxID=2730080 RepID=A0A6V8LU68_9BACT|nr:TolC family protein [Fundidesulfovibrio magnetotacticus]GFK94131.1 Outer membrane protein TolC [Fundidesulfovibrio magnetotacticus]